MRSRGMTTKPPKKPRKRQVTPEHSSFRRVAVFVPLRASGGARDR